MTPTDSKCQHITVHTATQTSPCRILSCVEKAPKCAHVSLIPVADSDQGSCNQPSGSRVLQDVHISALLMENFLELARENTEKDLETCGILGAFLEHETYYVTTLIIPKQESTSSSCEAVKEEEFFAIQNEHSLFPVGWIHTHPSQSCFMSSIDLHTHYSYQTMVPEAFAIVMAPTDKSSKTDTFKRQTKQKQMLQYIYAARITFSSTHHLILECRSYGIFRLSDPGGMSVLKECEESGFHPHGEPADGSPIYEHCTNVYTNTNLRFEIFDLR